MITRELHYSELFVLALLAVAVIFIGVLGFMELGHPVIDAIYLSVQLFVLESGAPRDGLPVVLEIARWAAPLLVAYTTIRALLLLSRNTMQSMKLRSYRKHVVICGLGQKGARLAEGYLENHKKVVAIEMNEQNDLISTFRQKGAIVLVGDAADTVLLNKAGVDKASTLFIVTTDDSENVEIAVRAFTCIRNQGQSRTPRIRCYVHIFKPELRNLFKQHHVFTITGDAFDARIFNVFDQSARVLFKDHPPDAYQLEDSQVRILIVGCGWMGQSIALQAARAGHYRNGRKISILIVDREITVIEQFLESYPMLSELVSVAKTCMDATRSSDLAALNGQKFSCVYVCLGDEEKSANSAQQLSGLFPSTSILLCMLPRTGLAALLEGSGMLPDKVNTFNMIHEACDPDAVVDDSLDKLAKRIHEHYRSGRKQAGNDGLSAQYNVRWDDLPEDAKESNRNQADHIHIKLRAVGYELCRPHSPAPGATPASGLVFTPEEIEILAEMEHNRWKAERFLDGWLYGPEKDIKEKMHPDLVKWELLPEAEQEVNRRAVKQIPDILTNWNIRRSDGKPSIHSRSDPNG